MIPPDRRGVIVEFLVWLREHDYSICGLDFEGPYTISVTDDLVARFVASKLEGVRVPKVPGAE